MEDLFDTPELIPSEVMSVILTFNENTYEECERVKDELESIGYTFDYYLDAEPYALRSIN